MDPTTAARTLGARVELAKPAQSERQPDSLDDHTLLQRSLDMNTEATELKGWSGADLHLAPADELN
jgi:hypothetical protein